MNNSTLKIKDSCTSITHYALTADHNKKLHEPYILGISSAYRCFLLKNEIERISPALCHYKVHHFVLAMSFASLVTGSLVKCFENDSCFKKVFEVIDGTNSFILRNLDPLINVACSVTYVAFIVFGYSASGAIGLTCLALSIAKKKQLLPDIVDDFLGYFSLAGRIVTLASPISLPLRIYEAAMLISCIAEEIIHHPRFLATFGEVIKNPFKGKYVSPFGPEIQAEDQIQFSKAIKFDIGGFRLNDSYLYDPAVGQLLPSDFEKRLKEQDTKQIFEQLRKAAKLTAEQINGLKQLETLAQQHQIVKAYAFSLLESLDTKMGYLLEFAKLGNNLQDGDDKLFDVIASEFSPTTEDIRWLVHHEIALFRARIINGILLESSLEKNGVLKNIGGAKNPILTNTLQRACWPQLRPYHAEVLNSLQPPSIFKALSIKKFLKASNADQFSCFDFAYYQIGMLGYHIFVLNSSIIEEILKLKNPVFIVRWFQTFSQNPIFLKAVQKWIKDNPVISDIVLPDQNKWLTGTLSTEGMLLLLWHLGIFITLSDDELAEAADEVAEIQQKETEKKRRRSERDLKCEG